MLKAPHLIPHVRHAMRLDRRSGWPRNTDAAAPAADAEQPAATAKQSPARAPSRLRSGRLRIRHTVKHSGLPWLAALTIVALLATVGFLYLSDGLGPAQPGAAGADGGFQHHLFQYSR